MNVLEEEMNAFQKETPFIKKRSTLIILGAWLFTAIIDITLNFNTWSRFKNSLGSASFYSFYLVFIFVLVPAACLLASLLLALIPFKELRYSKKYPSITVLLMLISQLFLLGTAIYSFVVNVL